jgi:hypothetical protein
MTTVVKWEQMDAAEVAVEGEPSRREMTVMRGELDDEERDPAGDAGGWSEMKAMNGKV